ncbi:hypothetical protein NDI47_10785 [Microcoleus vaginatus GB1-A2]|uniref:hypothetical protein n=1 Tax=Microcoleus vaginatus TaxID=119532 RepID=UPI00168975BA|nr:hypothetical protein [Microcoleus sp. FACHB-61]
MGSTYINACGLESAYGLVKQGVETATAIVLMDGFYLGCCNSSASQAIISWGRQTETANPTQTNIQKENLSYLIRSVTQG